MHLSKKAEDIRMGDLVQIMDGRLAPIACASEGAYERCTCQDEEHGGIRMLMIDVRNAIAGILDRYSLAQVVEVTLRKMRRDGVATPFAHLSAVAALKPNHCRKADPADGFLAELSQLATGHETENSQ
jgi:DNA-binding IscR family transcriptional regulator